MRGLHSGLLDESFGCGGPTLASELQQSQLSDVLQRTRVQWELFDYSNRGRRVSNPNPTHVTAMLQSFRLAHKLRRRSCLQQSAVSIRSCTSALSSQHSA